MGSYFIPANWDHVITTCEKDFLSFQPRQIYFVFLKTVYRDYLINLVFDSHNGLIFQFRWFIKRQTSGASSNNKWYKKMTTSDNKWQQMTTRKKKNIDDPREDSITEDHEEEPITENSMITLSLRTRKRTLSLENTKRILLLWNLKRILSLRTLSSFTSLNDFCATKSSFWYFSNGIWWSGWWGTNFHMKLLVLEGLVLMLSVT